jgi:hypothetical protein
MLLALEAARNLCVEYREKSAGAFWFLELLPGPLFLYCWPTAMFDLFYKLFVGTYFHYCGTCKMPSRTQDTNTVTHSDDAVVDDQLVVKVRVYLICLITIHCE